MRPIILVCPFFCWNFYTDLRQDPRRTFVIKIENKVGVFLQQSCGDKVCGFFGLNGFSDTFDVTLLLGPMYHLFTVPEQKQALSEAVRVTKSGGMIFAAYCGNDATMVQYCFGRGMLREQRYRDLVDPVTFKASSDPAELFQLYRREDIDELNAGLCVERLHYVGTDMATNYMRSAVDEMEDDLFELYLQYHYVICERQDMVGTSHHILDVLRKIGN